MRRLEFASLQVRDLEASKDFYTNKLGFEESEMRNPGAVVFKFKKGEASFAIRNMVEGLEGKPLGVGASLWFAVDDAIESLRERFEESGVPMLGSVKDTPFGKSLMVRDPDGYILTFLQPR